MARTYDNPPDFIPYADRAGRTSPWRDIACRTCGRWINHATGTWVHVDDDSPACCDPATLGPLSQPSATTDPTTPTN